MKKIQKQTKRLNSLRTTLGPYARQRRDASFAMHPFTRTARAGELEFIVDKLADVDALSKEAFEGDAFRATRLSLDPLAASYKAGRWMSRDTAAVLYTSLARDGALAEIVTLMARNLAKGIGILLLGLGGMGSSLAQVKIGILNDQAGPYSAITGPGSAAAAKLAVEDAGPVLGKPVEIVVGDHQGKPDIGASLAMRWFDVNGVSAIFDIYHSGVALAVQRFAQEKNKVLAISMASSRDIGGKACSPNGFQWANDGYEVANLTIKGASTATPNSWYFLTVDYAAGHSPKRMRAR